MTLDANQLDHIYHFYQELILRVLKFLTQTVLVILVSQIDVVLPERDPYEVGVFGNLCLNIDPTYGVYELLE